MLEFTNKRDSMIAKNTIHDDPLYMNALAVSSLIELRDFISALENDFTTNQDIWRCKAPGEYFGSIINYLSTYSCDEDWRAFAVLLLIPKYRSSGDNIPNS